MPKDSGNEIVEMSDRQQQEKWSRCLDFIGHNVESASFSTWFSPIVFEGVRRGQAVLRVPTQFFYEYIEEHYIGILRSAIHREFGEDVNIAYNVVTDSENNITTPLADDRRTTAVGIRPETRGNASPGLIDGLEGNVPQQLDSRLNPNYTFENFIEGDANKLPRSIGMSIADNPGQMTFNPLFVYGPSGVGKTHLANAIGIRIKERQPMRRVLYVSAHLFLVQYTDATRRNLRNDFLHFYQSIDVLIIDDIQEIAGESRKGTQEAFFHIFNHLQQTGHQLILTSDRPPVELEGVEERLLTRFKWGLVAELRKPDAKLARKILLHKIKCDGLVFPREVVDYVAANASQNIRDLEGVVNAILAYSVVYNSDVDLELAKRVVARSIRRREGNITIERIIDSVGQFYHLQPQDICSSSRKQLLVAARQIVMYLAQKHTGLSCSRIGYAVGGRDHSTVIHSCSVVERKIDTDKSFRKRLEEIEANL